MSSSEKDEMETMHLGREMQSVSKQQQATRQPNAVLPGDDDGYHGHIRHGLIH